MILLGGKPSWTVLELNLALHSESLATDHLSHVMVHIGFKTQLVK